MQIQKIIILITTLIVSAPSIAEPSTKCVDLMIGGGHLNVTSQGVNPGSPKRTGKAQFSMSSSNYPGHAIYKGYFSISGVTYQISSGEISGDNFSFTTNRFGRDGDGSAVLVGNGSCKSGTAIGTMAYRGDGDGYTFNISFKK